MKESKGIIATILFSSFAAIILLVVLNNPGWIAQLVSAVFLAAIYYFTLFKEENKFLILSLLLIFAFYAFIEVSVIFIPSLIFLNISLLVYLRKGRTIREALEELGFNKSLGLKTIFLGTTCFFITLLTVYLITTILLIFGVDDSQLVAEKIFSFPIAIIPIAVVLGPVTEEVFFRGLLCKRFGVLASSIVFSLMHIAYGSITELVSVFVIGIVFGLFFKYSRYNLYVPIIAHIIFNGLMITVLYLVM